MSKNVIFPDTVPFAVKHAPELQAKMDKFLSPLGLTSVRVGSSHNKDSDELTNDLDLQVDLDDIIRAFNAQPDPKNKKDTPDSAARRALSAHMTEHGFQTKQAGVNVFVRLPFGPNAHQVDLECIRKVAKVSRYHQHNIPHGSPYKGVSKQLMIASLAKQKGYVYSAWEGLFQRTPENKKGPLITDDWDEIAKTLLGQHATGDNIDSVEAIMKSLPHVQAEELLAHVRQDKNWIEKTHPTVTENALVWFKSISQKLAI